MHPLFTVDATQVTKDLLDDFLALALPESYTVEYKGAADNSTLEAVASMANSFGGIVLVGVEWKVSSKDRPGEVKGVSPKDREALVNKMATMYAPAWWSPEVIPVDVGDGRDVLILRIYADSAPRPLMFQGRVPMRMEGRKGNADLGQILRLAEESGTRSALYDLNPNHYPSGHFPVVGTRLDDPAVAVRAFTAAPIVQRMARPRIDQAVHDTVLRGLGSSRLQMHTMGLVATLCTGSGVTGWHIHRQSTNSRQVRMWMGTGPSDIDWPGRPAAQDVQPVDRAGVRTACFVAINGNALEVGIDLAVWIDRGNRPTWWHVSQSAHEVVRAAISVHETLMQQLIGQGKFPLSPVELHIEAGVDPGNPSSRSRLTSPSVRVPCGLADVVDLEGLGPPGRPDEQIRRGSEMLSDDLIQVGNIDRAVAEALNFMTLDWGYFKPQER